MKEYNIKLIFATIWLIAMAIVVKVELQAFLAVVATGFLCNMVVFIACKKQSKKCI